MKHRTRFFISLVMLIQLFVMSLILVNMVACSSGKQSAIEGKLLDWNMKPVAGVKVIARQVKPLKGYEKLETVTNSDGVFLIKGLFPSSEYLLSPVSSKWYCVNTSRRMESAPQGETATCQPIQINHAFSRKNGSLVIDLATGATRFSVSSDGVITDALTGLQWVIGPQNITFSQAKHWMTACKIAGGNWHMPTLGELRHLFEKNNGKTIQIDRTFKNTNWFIWIGQANEYEVFGFDFYNGMMLKQMLQARFGVFGVRARPL